MAMPLSTTHLAINHTGTVPPSSTLSSLGDPQLLFEATTLAAAAHLSSASLSRPHHQHNHDTTGAADGLDCDSDSTATVASSSCSISVSPSPSSSSTSTSSLFFGAGSSLGGGPGPASSVNSLTSTSFCNSSAKSSSSSACGGDVDSLLTTSRSSREESCSLLAGKVELQPVGRLSLRQPRMMGQSNQTTTLRAADPLTRPRLKECNNQQQPEGYPHRIRLLDGEERGLAEPQRTQYSSFQLTGREGMNNVILPPPNRTVDHSVCENFSLEHRCMGDAGFCAGPPCPPYGSHLGDSFYSSQQKKHSDSSSSSSSSRSGKFKEVIKSVFNRVVRSPGSRSSGDGESAKARASSETRCMQRPAKQTSTDPVTVSGSRRTSPQSRLPSSASARTGLWSSPTDDAPPTYDVVMKESNKPKRK